MVRIILVWHGNRALSAFFVLPDILKNAEDRKTERLEHSVKGCNISIV